MKNIYRSLQASDRILSDTW